MGSGKGAKLGEVSILARKMSEGRGEGEGPLRRGDRISKRNMKAKANEKGVVSLFEGEL